jgi:hypothetical protein
MKRSDVKLAEKEEIQALAAVLQNPSEPVEVRRASCDTILSLTKYGEFTQFMGILACSQHTMMM